MLKLLLLWIVLPASAQVHVHPVPNMPSDLDPATSNDVFSIGAIAQIHQALFRIDNNSVPLPRLVDSFTVSRDQLVYAMDLRALRFHDGHPLAAEDAKYSLERAVALKAPGYERLRVVRGFQAFVDGKAKGVSGLTAEGRRFTIHLTEPFPSLIETLVDVRFSILSKAAKTPTVGLGPYEVAPAAKGAFELKRRAGESGGPAAVRFVRESQDQAVEDFSRGRAGDLFGYTLTKAEVARVSAGAVVQLIQAPRTYFLAVNPRLVKGLPERDAILSRVDAAGLIKQCYPDNQPTSSIVPPGFPGYISDAPRERTKNGKPSDRKLKVLIARGVDAEDCVKARLEKDLGPSADVEIVDVDAAVSGWQKDKTELVFAYLEGENTLDMFQFFNPSSSLTFGVPGDRWMLEQFASYNLLADPAEKHRRTERLSRHILALRTVLPLFHPRQFIVYSGGYKPLKLGVRSSTFIDFSALEAK
jgi:ABC-type oligopeptide transport system substrate-binding subunit